jgi:hypothetical protein
VELWVGVLVARVVCTGRGGGGGQALCGVST